ncbi:HAMP domain-containing histidine kinase [Aestuariicella hydrocarbonica]|uniref:histidine kinase n=1 Tax=Pseudomaricurvus hydrocarbonicus TaxID=1470433 RepID=A0A9E5MLK9_9GAMM|nr:HAMP domain-containing sensor histidine kinase [Aestuariicella hydrocarbonica]NHO64085.1 HAMP domain-containing histidine kinase [Aestuariicella hydrocarbonica]
MNSFKFTASAPEANLRRLLMIRGLFLLMVCATLGYCFWQLQLPLAYRSILWVLTAMTVVSIASLVQLHASQRTSELAFFTQLLIDVVAVSLLLFFAGGADNPFVSYYLVPLCIAAATLPRHFTWPLVLISLLLYSSLIFFKIPLPDIAPHHSHGSPRGFSNISIHTIGMWINFLFSALLISYFVLAMATSLRRQDAALAELKEDRLRDDQLMALATLAAGTAHDLGTPLTTIKALLHEMQSEYVQAPRPGTDQGLELKNDLELLQNQVSHCTTTLQQLNRQAGELKDGILPLNDLRQQCSKIIDNWMLLRPEVEARVHWDDLAPQVQVRWQPTVAHSISNLLNNAADANPKGIAVDVHWTREKLTLQIHDKGPGIEPELAQDLGKAFVTHKGQGRGLGLFLTRAAIKRYGGEVTIAGHPQQGTLTTLTLPLHPGGQESQS